MLECRVISSLEKILPEQPVLDAPELVFDIAARGEIYSFQIAMRHDVPGHHLMRFESASELNLYIRVVRPVPVLYAGPVDATDVLRNNQPGLYPDLLAEPDFTGQFRLVTNVWSSLWVTVIIGKDQKPGVYPVKLTIRDLDTNETVAEPEFKLEVRDFELAPRTMHNFHWFHADCLFSYYKVPCWSEAHWQIIENFARNAFAHDIDTLYTPLWTPPLDTAVGHARPTCQLLDVTLDLSTMKYSFDFARLRRWIELGRQIGFPRFAMSHIYTQWGAASAPKIMATAVNAERSIAAARYGAENGMTKLVNNCSCRIFGWDTDSLSAEYCDFLSQLMPQLLAVLREYDLGKENCFFSLSDEPNETHLERYEKLVKFITPLLEEFETVEALSHIDFYKRGLVKNPYPSIKVLRDFEDVLPHNGYFCCGPVNDSPNRFISFPSRRPRSFGILAYVHDLAGFLHWGFNFYYSQYSCHAIDPFATTDADGAFPAGDAFLVYPGPDGTPWDSIRHEVFFAGLQDMRACRTLEKKIGREGVLAIINRGLDHPVSMMDFPCDDNWLPGVRRAIYDAITKS